MSEERLFERLSILERDPQRRGAADQGRTIDSIVIHLRFLLNTRQGGVPMAKDYGIPDLLDFLQRYPESVREIESSIQQAIERYEPRLGRVRVAFLPQEDDVLSLRFHIDAHLREENDLRISFETVVGTDGRILVRR